MRDYIITTVATIAVAAVLLFALSIRETSVDPGEYQLIIENDSIIISDHSRHVKTIHLSSTGELENVLIQDNE